LSRPFRVEGIEALALKYALLNAIRYGGQASKKAVISKIFAERPELRPYAREIVNLVAKAVEKVNKLTLDEQRRLIEERWPELLEEKERKEEKKELPPLPNADKFKKIRTRFAPNPDFDIHIGNARAAIISYKYAEMYKGDFILRFEDTDPKTKTPILEAYDVIRENLKWLGLKWSEEYIQSLRMEHYYEKAKELIQLGGAYVCTCPPNKIKEDRLRGLRCKHAYQSIEESLDLWERMLEGEFKEQEAVLRVKTDPKYPDPSVRDWIAFRVIDTSKYPHPLVGDKYIVWPTYNFACGIDDHLLSISHILRGKEHIVNTIKQKYMYKHFGWKYPEAIHMGRLKLEGFILSKSKIRAGIEKGIYSSWDDIRLATLSALRRKGILPQAIWEVILDVGIKPSEARISIVNLHAINRKYLEPLANRYMFVKDPVKVKILNPPFLEAELPFHPSYPERGKRKISVSPIDNVAHIFISGDDSRELKEGSTIRLMGLYNIKVLEKKQEELIAEVIGISHKKAHVEKIPILQWVPCTNNVRVEVYRAKGNQLYIEEGLGEPAISDLKVNSQVQFIRYGFVKIEEKSERGIKAIYTHD